MLLYYLDHVGWVTEASTAVSLPQALCVIPFARQQFFWLQVFLSS